MHGILPWHIWIIIRILFIIIEILDPAFFFVALGFGAILTGLLSLLPFVEASIPLQIIIFAILSFVAFLLTRHLGKKFLANAGGETNVFALKGKEAHVTEIIPADGKGRVKVGSEEWVAIAEDKGEIAIGAKVVVLDIDGNKLVVRKDS